MPIHLNYDICKTVESVRVNFTNKKDTLKELQNEIKSLKNLSQPFNVSSFNILNEQKQKDNIKAQIKYTQNIINQDKKDIETINIKLKEKYNAKTLINNLVINLHNISLSADEVVKSGLSPSVENEIKNLNQQKETISIRLNKNESILADLNNKLDFLSYPNKETLDFLFYTEVFPNEIKRGSIPKQKINIDCIKNMINIHEKGLFISLDSKIKIKTYTDFLKK